MCKVKTRWWMNSESKLKRRWCRDGPGKDAAMKRAQKKQSYMENKEQRVVLRGWGTGVNPAIALQVYPTASKVEALYRRTDGRQGTVILGFKDKEATLAVRGKHQVEGRTVWAEQAYSGRSRANQHMQVRVWWRRDGESAGVSESARCARATHTHGSGCKSESEDKSEEKSEDMSEGGCEYDTDEEWMKLLPDDYVNNEFR